jgi:hypothetical protein
MAESKTTKTNTTQTPRVSAKSSTTKHGNGLDRQHVQSVEDMQQARYRKFVSSHEYTKKDIVLTVLATVLVCVALEWATSRWYGF